MSRFGVGFVVLATVFVCAATAFAQDFRGTPEQRLACTSDAFRLCAIYIPDGGKVEACLRSRKSNLSAGCRSVFSQNIGSAPQASTLP
jgi:hypothetical protein